MNEKLQKRLAALNETSSLADVQDYINEMIEARGFGEETLKDVMILLTEELGELARVVRKFSNMKMDTDKNYEFDASGEIADIFIYLLGVCRLLKIDLFTAFKEKENRNSQRVWK